MKNIDFDKIDIILDEFSHRLNSKLLKKHLDYEVRVINISRRSNTSQFWVDLDYENDLYILNLWDYKKRKVKIYSTFEEIAEYTLILEKIIDFWSR